MVRTGAGWGQDSSAPSGLTDNPQARLIVVVEVDQGRRSGEKPPPSHSEEVQPGRASWERGRVRPFHVRN